MDERTWYEKGYEEGYEEAAKIARVQYALVNLWADRLARAQEKVRILEDFINEVVSLRDVMNYPNGEQILNDVRTLIDKRAK